MSELGICFEQSSEHFDRLKRSELRKKHFTEISHNYKSGLKSFTEKLLRNTNRPKNVSVKYFFAFD